MQKLACARDGRARELHRRRSIETGRFPSACQRFSQQEYIGGTRSRDRRHSIDQRFIVQPDDVAHGTKQVLAEIFLLLRNVSVADGARYAAANGGRQFAWEDLLIVLAWGVAGTVFAVRRFTWSPRRS